MSKLKCHICDRNLSNEEIGTLSEHRFNDTCLDHRHFSNSFNRITIRISKAYPVDSADLKCAVCGKKLSLAIISNLSYDDFHLTCSDHRNLANYFNIHIARSLACPAYKPLLYISLK